MLAVVPERCYASNHQLPRGGPHDATDSCSVDISSMIFNLDTCSRETACSFSLGGWRHINFVIRKKKKKDLLNVHASAGVYLKIVINFFKRGFRTANYFLLNGGHFLFSF